MSLLLLTSPRRRLTPVADRDFRERGGAREFGMMEDGPSNGLEDRVSPRQPANEIYGAAVQEGHGVLK
nr:unnamed protein product [Digitaria exilis]